MVIVVALSVVELADGWAEEHALALSAIHLLSLLACVVAELGLIRMGEELLRGRRAHLKFWTMKALFVANTMFGRAFKRVVKGDVVVGELCYSRETLVAAWAGGCTAVFAFFVAVLAAVAFTPADLEDRAEEAAATESAPAADV
mmetsp:Transcript_4926/g.13976  ORF Transcript_4926/g.13976 Transcript_4926/m.13976 type:complete len:144 (-) Transcript_4926:98-529(-)